MATHSATGNSGLTGLNVLLTRPLHDGEQWQSAFEQAGATVSHIPTLAIEPVAAPADLLQQVGAASIGLFVSGNAVRAMAEALNDCEASGVDIAALKKASRWFAVGEKTEALAREHGFAIEPVAASDSETLLAHSGFSQLDKQHCLIVRGEGGRELLAKTLRTRGATVNYCELYRRNGAWQNEAALASYLRGAESDSSVVTASSVDALNYSFLLAEKANMEPNMQRLPFLVPSARVAEAARQRGVRCLIQAQTMRLADIVYELKTWWAEQQ